MEISDGLLAVIGAILVIVGIIFGTLQYLCNMFEQIDKERRREGLKGKLS
ncbi:MAG: hypothetical protein Q8P08_00335 [bacterium]|nr:hypothetical protein [bacterium]